MPRRLKLSRSQVVGVDYRSLGAFRLRVDVSDPSDSGADPYVFLLLRRPQNPYGDQPPDDFHAVASPADMAEYPVNSPRDGTAYPFYRSDHVELDFRASSQAEEVWLAIVAEVGNLLAALDRLDVLEVSAEVWVGAPADSGGSDSGSASASQ